MLGGVYGDVRWDLEEYFGGGGVLGNLGSPVKMIYSLYSSANNGKSECE